MIKHASKSMPARPTATTGPSGAGGAGGDAVVAPSIATNETQFPLGTMTMGLPEWYAIVGLANQCGELFKPLRNILAHIEIGSPPQAIQERITYSYDDLSKAFHIMNTLLHEIQIQNTD